MHAIPAPGILWGSYPERGETPGPARRPALKTSHRQTARNARRYCAELARLDDAGFDSRLADLGLRLARWGLTGEAAGECLAMASEAMRRVLAINVYDTQLLAAAIILDNKLAEMATGEGKTVAAALAAASAALAGMPVHVLTANDYLVKRDAEYLTPVFRRLGLTVGFVLQGMEDTARHIAYRRHVTYVTGRELVFDYLRDGLRRGSARSEVAYRARALEREPEPLVLRGLCMAVIDEADNLLIDEARTPLILSATDDDAQSRSMLWQAFKLTDHLVESQDFVRHPSSMHVDLTDAGRERLHALATPLGGRWRSRRLREELASQALSAKHGCLRDLHYLVRDGRVEIIDETTGRAAPGRVWSHGLHTLVELKEGCKPTPPTRTLAQMTYQRFFARYIRLGGMGGTLREARRELRQVYGLPVVRVPLRVASARVDLPARLFADRNTLWAAVLRRVIELRSAGRPVLIGTGSVAESEALSACLVQAGIPHQVLNASRDEEEAAIIARAGGSGQVTVTTNMAGRGTDIALDPVVTQSGGLHVLCCQHNASRRIDRQLQGRCARQGDPGSTETWLALDERKDASLSRLARRLGRVHAGEVVLPGWLLGTWLDWRQRQHSECSRRIRRQLMEADREWEIGLSFRGRGE